MRSEERSGARQGQIQLWLTPTELAALDAYIAVQPAPLPTRAEAVRQIISATLAFSSTY